MFLDAGLENIETHLRTSCRIKSSVCTNAGCNKLLLDSNLAYHCNVCFHTPGSCSKCGKSVLLGLFESHVQKECSEVEITCTQCKLSLRRSELNNHLRNDCPGAMVSCKIAGCNHCCKRLEMGQHMQEEAVKHVSLLQVGCLGLHE